MTHAPARAPAARAPARRAECAAAAAAFLVAAFAAFAPGAPLARDADAPTLAARALLFAVLVGAYLALTVAPVRDRLGATLRDARWRALLGPALVLVAALAHAAATAQPVAPRAALYAPYLLAPAFLVAWALPPGAQQPIRTLPTLAAVALLWLPVEFRLLPPLRVPGPDGTDVVRFLGLVDALWLFLVARPVPDVGYTLALRGRDVAVGTAAFAVYAVVAVPLAFATGFVTWHPRLQWPGVVAIPLLIYAVTAVPEEFLFRGLIQNTLAQRLRPGAALAVASVIFGLAHLPDPRYVLLATLAGVAYGWVYQRTGRVTAAAITHALVDAVWVLLLRA